MLALLYLAGWLIVRSRLNLPHYARMDALRNGIPQRHWWFMRLAHESLVLWTWWAIAIGGLVAYARSR